MTVIEKCSNLGTRLHPASIALLTLLLGSAMPAASAHAAAPPAKTAAPATPPNTQAGSVAPLSPDVAKALNDAEAAIKANKPDVALIYLRDAVRRAPKDARVRTRLGIALMNSGDGGAAERELRQALADGAPYQTIFPPLLQAMLMRGKTKDLLDEFPDPPAEARDGIAADILRARASALQGLGQTADARASIERSLAIRRDAPALLTRAKIAAQQGDIKLAIASVSEAIKLDPSRADALRFKIAMLHLSGDKQGSLDVANNLLKLSPNNLAAKISRIMALIDLNRDAEAKQDIDEVLKQAPNSTAGRYYKAVLLTHARNYKDAWRVAVTLPPEFAQSDSEIGIMIAQMAILADNLDTGNAVLASLVAAHPELTEARLRLGALRLQQGHADVALGVLEPAGDTDDPEAQALLGQAYLKLNRYADAIGALVKAGPAGNDNPPLKGQPQFSDLQGGKSEIAIEGLRLLVEKDPSRAEYVAPLVAALSRAGKLDEALAVTDRMEKADKGKSALAPFLRGQILILKNNLPGALAAFDQSLALDPKYVPALYFRARVAQSRGDLAGAIADRKTIVAQEPKDVPAYVKLADTLPKSVDAQLLMAAAYDASADPRSSLSSLRRAVGLAPASIQVRTLLIDTLADSGETKDALAAAQDYGKANPGPVADILTADTLVKLKRNDDAVALLRKSLASKLDGRLALRLQQLETAKADLTKVPCRSVCQKSR